MSPCLDRLQRCMPLLRSMPKHVWSYSSVMTLYAMVTRAVFGARATGSSYGAIFFLYVSRHGPRSVVRRVVYKGFGTYNPMYLLSFAVRRISALLAAMLRPPRALCSSQWSQHSLAVEACARV
jgi:hypothetical protein